MLVIALWCQHIYLYNLFYSNNNFLIQHCFRSLTISYSVTNHWLRRPNKPICKFRGQVCHSRQLHHSSVLLHRHGHCKVSRYTTTTNNTQCSTQLLQSPFSAYQLRVTLLSGPWWTLRSAPSRSWPFTSRPCSEVTTRKISACKRSWRRLLLGPCLAVFCSYQYVICYPWCFE